MPTTRNQGITANKAPAKPKAPRTRKKKSDKAAKKTKAQILPDGVTESPLFKLPPELRNTIYRFAIVTEDDLQITKTGGIPEPALLSVSKTVRSETFGLFYHENRFSCIVRYYDPASILLAVCRALDFVTSTGPGGIDDFASDCYDEPNWRNLVQWLHLCSQAGCRGFARSDGDDTQEELLAGLFETVMENPDITTRGVDILLAAMRPVLVDLDKDWAKD